MNNWRRRRVLPALLALSALVVWWPSPASAQARATTSDDDPALKVKLTSFPISVGPSDSLTAGLEVENTGKQPMEELEVAITVYRGLTSRFELANSYEGRQGRVIASDTLKVDGGLAPGEKRAIEVSKQLSEIAAFRNSTTDRAHPVRIVVRAGDVAAEPVDTYMVYFSQPPEKPLGISLVVPLHSPAIYTDAARPDLVTSDTLEKSVTTGRLNDILTAIDGFPELPVTLAPTGLLVSMLQDMSDGYPRRVKNQTVNVDREDPRALGAARALSSIKSLITRPNTKLIATTYSTASLPALNKYELTDLADAQVTEGRNILKGQPVGLLGGQPLPNWLLPADGDLDDASLAGLQHTDLDHLILSSRSVRQLDAPLTRALPIRLEGGGRIATDGLSGVETTALVADAGLYNQMRDGHELGVVEARQRFAAETAIIHLETPGLNRAVLALAPFDWQVGPETLRGILSTLDQAPWLVPYTPERIVSELSPPADEQFRLVTSDSLLTRFEEVPTSSYFRALENAQGALDRYAELAPPPAQLGAFSRRLLIAESTDWWSSKSTMSRGLAIAEAVPTAVDSEINGIRAPASQTITLTSRTGVIPLSVGSALKYPVDVIIQLDSDKLRFPDGNRIQVDKLRPPNQTFKVRAISQSSGTFPLKVRVLTPSGQLVSDSQLTIRSTAYNVVALSITGGAGVFMVGWWAIGAIRRRLSVE